MDLVFRLFLESKFPIAVTIQDKVIRKLEGFVVSVQTIAPLIEILSSTILMAPLFKAIIKSTYYSFRKQPPFPFLDAAQKLAVQRHYASQILDFSLPVWDTEASPE
ncbi:hypothetical protein [Robiginitalea sp. SC105]|uniref:hypothetical protein n=1 Tax=Robiginitalea sp. SC105 TaxID=2762332 RepID=UPI0016397D6A|nr:hypothetical protein [Robiginitalea sp. SC105]MBC2840317.1 hypothetical protein [Robiginitalea sp. SC105]